MKNIILYKNLRNMFGEIVAVFYFAGGREWTKDRSKARPVRIQETPGLSAAAWAAGFGACVENI